MINLPPDVQLVAVSKTRTIEEILHIYEQGQRDFGENRVQELLMKKTELSAYPDIRWHLIGTLQSNKVNRVVGQCALIQSVHSLSLYRKIVRQAEYLGVTQPVLLQVNFSGEASKHGFDPDAVEAVLALAAETPSVPILGLMTMSQADMSDAEKLEYFQRFAEFYNGLKERYGLSVLSIGMSDDYHLAIEAGATMVRLGTAIFGPRQY